MMMIGKKQNRSEREGERDERRFGWCVWGVRRKKHARGIVPRSSLFFFFFFYLFIFAFSSSFFNNVFFFTFALC